MNALSVGVDVGGTKISAALVDHEARVSERVTMPTPAAEGRAAVVERIVAAVTQVLAACHVGREVLTIGIGTAGVVDPETGTIVASTDTIRDWAGTALGAEVSARTGLDVSVMNDVVAFLRGEALHGSARGASNAIAVTVGTGIGGAILADGMIIRGRRDAAGHLGHVAAPTHRRCSCGRTGHVEAIASGPAIAAEYSRLLGEDGLSVPDVVLRARSGDPAATRVLTQAGLALGLALGGVVNALAPDVVVLGGGVAFGAELFVDAVREALSSTVLPALADVRVELGSLGHDAVILGAVSVLAPGAPR
ncbi:ROK family protein [soil metagenome]